jgi:uncharacterized protein (DUF58 family)
MDHSDSNAELFKEIRKIEIYTRRLVNDQLAGQYQSVFKGRGMAFDEVRQYQPGDDVRLIDWNVSARMNGVYVKLFTEEREMTVMLVVDVSASELFGTTHQTKARLAAKVAATMAFSAIKNNDRVGLIMFTDRIEMVVPPKKGKKHVLRVISEILRFRPTGRGTDIKIGLDYLGKIAKHRAVAFLISILSTRDGISRCAWRRPGTISFPSALPIPGRKSSGTWGCCMWKTRRPEMFRLSTRLPISCVTLSKEK